MKGLRKNYKFRQKISKTIPKKDKITKIKKNNNGNKEKLSKLWSHTCNEKIQNFITNSIIENQQVKFLMPFKTVS